MNIQAPSFRWLALLLAGAPAAARVPQQATAILHHGDVAGGEFGTTVERIGDVNFDGVRDFAVGAPFADATVEIPFTVFIEGAGSVSVFSGTTGSLLWKTLGPPAGNSEFGATIANAGDVNGDGFEDVLVGAPAGDGVVPGSGMVQLLSGLSGNLMDTFKGTQTGERFGEAICAGHLDPSTAGIEVAIGAPAHDVQGIAAGHNEEGRVVIIDVDSGQATNFLPGTPYNVLDGLLLTDTYERKRWGAHLAYLGDPDNDGFGTLVVSAPSSDLHDTTIIGPQFRANTGFVRVWEPYGGPGIFDTTWNAGGENDYFGFFLESLGDLNGDGLVDWGVYNSGDCALSVYSGPSNLLWTSNTVCVQTMGSMADIGDWNGDGTGDLAVGLPGNGTAASAVCILGGVFGDPIGELFGPGLGDLYGCAVAGADMNGDGHPEVWVGARHDKNGGTDAGAVFIESDHPCIATGEWGPYGTATPGTLGSPFLISSTQPVMGTTFPMQVTNSTLSGSTAALVIGVEPIEVAVLGGTLLVDPVLIETFPLSAGVGTTISLGLPIDPVLCGLTIYLQVLFEDPGAPGGYAFTQGMWIDLGS